MSKRSTISLTMKVDEQEENYGGKLWRKIMEEVLM
jgi:hypothetical protein